MEQPGDRAPAPGPLAVVQDLINTYDIEGGRDTLGDLTGLRAFCAEHQLPPTGLTVAGLDTVRRFRELLREACRAHSGVPMPAKSAAALADLLDGAPLVLVVDAAGDVRTAPAAGATGAAALVGRIAGLVLAAAGAGSWRRLKVCASDRCRWAYYDHSPGGRSRWCTMSVCGSRAKMRAYRASRGAASRRS